MYALKRCKTESMETTKGEPSSSISHQEDSSSAFNSSNEFKPKRTMRLKLQKPNVGLAEKSNDVMSTIKVSSQESETISVVEFGDVKSNVKSVVEMSEVSEIETKFCSVCAKPVSSAVYNSHLFRCLRRFQYPSVDDCPECKISLKRMSKLKKQEHIKWCSKLPSESDSSDSARTPHLSPSVILDCPFCGKYSNSPLWRSSHMLKCAKSKKFSMDEYETAVRLQEKQAEERMAAGLSVGPAKQIDKPKSNPRARPIMEPATYHQEDIQMAKALSLSLEDEKNLQREEDEFVFQTVVSDGSSMDEKLIKALTRTSQIKSSEKNKKKNTTTPLLLLRSADDRAKIIADRVAEILSKPRCELDLKTCSFYVNWKETKIARNWPSKLESCRVWQLSTLADEIIEDPKCFYTPIFQEFDTFETVISDRRKRLSSIPGYKLETAIKNNIESNYLNEHNYSQTTQSIMEQLYEENNTKAGNPESLERNSSDISVDEEEQGNEMRDGFFTQIEKNTDGDDSTLSTHFLEMVGNSELSDASVLVEHEITIPCHRFVFCARCPIAYKELCNDGNVLDWRDITYGGAMAFLKFLYAGIKPDDYYVNEIRSLARKYEMVELSDRFVESEDNVESLNIQSNASSQGQSKETLFIYSGEPNLEEPHSRVTKREIEDIAESDPSESEDSGSASPILFCSTPLHEANNEIRGEVNNTSEHDLGLVNNYSLQEQTDISSVKIAAEMNLGIDDNLKRIPIPISSISTCDTDTFISKSRAFLSPTTSLINVSSSSDDDTFRKRKLLEESDCDESLHTRIKRMKGETENIRLYLSDDESEKVEQPALSPFVLASQSPKSDDNISTHISSQASASPLLSDQAVLEEPGCESSANTSSPVNQKVDKRKQRQTKPKRKVKAVTPMPRYSLMKTPEIAKKLKSIGVKNLGKKKGKEILKHIFKETHKDSATDDDLPSTNSQSSTSTAKNQKSRTDQSSKMIAQMRAYIKDRSDLHMDAPIDIEQLHEQVLEAGIKHSMTQLKNFMDNECIANGSFKDRNPRRKVKSKNCL